MERLTEQLARLKQQASVDREALKRATRAQKQRAERSEGTAGQLSVQLLDMVWLRHNAGQMGCDAMQSQRAALQKALDGLARDTPHTGIRFTCLLLTSAFGTPSPSTC